MSIETEKRGKCPGVKAKGYTLKKREGCPHRQITWAKKFPSGLLSRFFLLALKVIWNVLQIGKAEDHQ
jgi:hypothetical protein